MRFFKKNSDLRYSGIGLFFHCKSGRLAHSKCEKNSSKFGFNNKKSFFVLTFYEVKKTCQKCQKWTPQTKAIPSFFCSVFRTFLNQELGSCFLFFRFSSARPFVLELGKIHFFFANGRNVFFSSREKICYTVFEKANIKAAAHQQQRLKHLYESIMLMILCSY